MRPGDIVTHTEMCAFEGGMLQRGMTFRTPPHHGVILMSQRANAPYADVLDDDGNLIYEGHDAPRSAELRDAKSVDQPRATPRGRPTENGKFADWADESRAGRQPAALFHVFEKIKDGIWSFRGPFLLVDYRYEPAGTRNVFKFVLKAIDEPVSGPAPTVDMSHEAQTRQIPTWVKQFVYKRDRGHCVQCGATDNLHYDHDLPYSLGGSSALPTNVRILCARHNLSKGARIE